MKSTSDDIFNTAAECLQVLSNLVGDKLNQYLNVILPAFNQKVFNKKYGTIVSETLSILDRSGGDAGYAIIKSKIPTYSRI